MLRVLHQRPDDPAPVPVPADELAARRGAAGWLWVDVLAPRPDEVEWLGRAFGLDPLTLDDVASPTVEFPKLDELDAYLFVVVHALAADAARIRTVELHACLGDGWLVTFHDDELPGLERVLERPPQRPPLAGPDDLLARLLELTTRRYLPLLDELDLRIFDLEDHAVLGNPEVLPEVQALRRDAAVVRRVLGPQRSMLLGLARDERPLVGDWARRNFADAHDHVNRVVESLDAAHAMLATVLDTYRGAVAEDMNQAMKVLTTFSAIILPMSLVAGVYGMNFTWMPETEYRYGYFVVLSVMALGGAALWLYFARRGLIGRPRLGDVLRAATAAGGVGRRVGRGLAAVPGRASQSARRGRDGPPAR